MACGILFLTRTQNVYMLLHSRHEVLTTGPPAKSQYVSFCGLSVLSISHVKKAHLTVPSLGTLFAKSFLSPLTRPGQAESRTLPRPSVTLCGIFVCVSLPSV